MQHNDHNNTANSQEEEINLRKILYIGLNNWLLFAFCGLVGLAGGYGVSRFSQPNYQVTSTIFVPQKSSGAGKGLEDIFMSQLTNSKSEVFNQIEILKSFNLNQQVAQNLNWRTSWFKKNKLTVSNLFKARNLFSWKAFYRNVPFQIIEKNGANNQSGVRLYVYPIDHQKYELSADEEVIVDGSKLLISFNSVANFGENFKNDYFDFTLVSNQKETEEIESDYSFVFNEANDIAQAYQLNLKVDLNDKQSEIIKMQLLGKEPGRSIDYLNELTDVFMLNKMNIQTETQKKSLKFIDSQLIGITDSLRNASSKFSKFRSENQIIDVGEQGKQIMTSLLAIETDKNKNQLQLDYFNNLYDYIGRSDGVKQLVSPSVIGIQDASLNSMVLSLSELYSRRQVLSFSAKENNPALLMIDKEIAQLNARLKENLKNLIANAESLNQSLDTQKARINLELNLLPKKEQELINYQRRYDLANTIYTFMLQKRSEMDIALAGATAEVQIIDKACLETTVPVGLSNSVKILMGLLLGLFLPGLYLVLFNFFNNSIDSQEDIERHTNLPVLGNVIHNHSLSNTPIHDNPRSGIAESYRAIRTNLQFMLNCTDCKTVAIHSINPGEGKSFSSANLATILAMNNKKVVLIGLDMRKPSTHKIFEVHSKRGLSTYLSGQDTLEEILMKTSVDNLSLITAGPIPPNPAELIDKPEMTQLLKKLGEKFDYIILDNAPVSLVTDGLLAGRHADLNVFILRYAVTKKDSIKYINQLADNKILNNIALIVNDIHGSGFGYGRNYYYNYKYSYYHKGYYKGYYYEEDEEPTGIRKILNKLRNK